MSTRSLSGRVRPSATAAIAALTVGAVALLGLTPAAAAQPKMVTAISAVTDSVTSGAAALYRITYSCSNVTADDCVAPTFTIPRPVGTAPDGSSVPTTGAPTFSGNADVASTSGSDDFVVTLRNLTPGTTGEFQVGWTIPTNTTLPGTTFPGTVGTTFTPGIGNPPVTVPAASTPKPVQSTASPQISGFKQMVSPAYAAAVTPDTDVTYRLYACNPKYNGQGSLNYTNLSLVDTLPKGAQFVSATGGGAYDAAAETVTWTVEKPAPAGCGTPPADQSFEITVRYPSATFVPPAADPQATNQFTNTLDVAATALDGTPLTATASQTHAFQGPPITGGSQILRIVTKNATGPAIKQPDTSTRYGWSYVANWYDTRDSKNSNRLRTFTVVDRTPCITGSGNPASPVIGDDPNLANGSVYGSFPVPSDQCTKPAFDTQVLYPNGNVRGNVDGLQVITWDGSAAHIYSADMRSFTGWVYKNTAQTGYVAGTDHSLDIPDDEVITDVRWTGRDLPSISGGGGWFYQNGVSTKAFVATGDLSMQNSYHWTLASSEYAPGDPLPTTGGGSGSSWSAIKNFDPSTIDPQVSKKATSDVSKLQPGDTASWQVQLSNGPGANEPMNPELVDVIPTGMEFQPNSVRWSNLGSLPEPKQTIGTVDIDGVSHQKVTWTWPAGTKLESTSDGGPTPTVDFETLVTLGATDGTNSGENGQLAALFDQNGPWTASGNPAPVDQWDLDGDGDTGENYAGSTVSWTVPVSAGATIEKFVKGARDADWTTNGLTNATLDGSDSQIDYRFDISNPNTTKLTDLVVYDVFPHQGDTGISDQVDDQDRGSQWTPTFDSITTLPTGGRVDYSTSDNPCRPELYEGTAGQDKPAGCDDDWSATVPSEPSDVTAIRVTVPELDPGADVGAIQFRMQAPKLTGLQDHAITDPTEVANNNVAWHVFRTSSTGTAQSLPAAEAPLVSVRRAAGVVGDRVWFDENRNGLQDAGEPGVDGVTVTLLDDAGNPVVDGNGDPITTTTDADGKYSFAVPLGTYRVSFTNLPAKYELTKVSVGSDDAIDSDAPGVGQATHPVTLTDPVTDGDGANVNLNLDAGLVLADVSVSKDDGKSMVKPGDGTTYTIAVRNNSATAEAVDVPVTDTLPGEVDFVSASDGGSYDKGSGKVSWTIPSIPAGATADVTVTVQVKDSLAPDTEIRNVATVPGSVCTTDCEGTDIDRTPPRVTIVKDDHKQIVKPGEELTYDLTVANKSTLADATGVVVTDTLPKELTFGSASDGGTYDQDTHTVTWQLGTLAKDTTKVVHVTATVAKATPSGSTITNGATVDTDQGCIVKEDCETTDIDHTPDVSIHKDDHRSVLAVDGKTTYDLSVTNKAKWDSTGTVVTDTLPKNTTFVSATNDGTYDAATRTVTWKLGTLPGNSTRTVQVTVQVAATAKAGDKVVNTASVTTDHGCSDANQCTSTDTDRLVPPGSAQLAFTGTSGLWTIGVGGLGLLAAGLALWLIRGRKRGEDTLEA